jgi:hypothetical protein
MPKADYAAPFALCAALASAIGDVIRQRSAATIALARGEEATMAAGPGHDVVLRQRCGVESLAAARGARVFIAHVSTVAWKMSCEEG